MLLMGYRFSTFPIKSLLKINRNNLDKYEGHLSLNCRHIIKGMVSFED